MIRNTRSSEKSPFKPIPVPDYVSVVLERHAILRHELEAILSPPGNFILEVGCGHGHFLVAYAECHQDKVCIGIDLATDRVRRAIKKRTRANLANLHFLRADAHLFLTAIPGCATIGTVFMLFPDPWPKSRHHKHRVLQPSFLEAIAARAAPGCQIHFRTDYRPYFDAARMTINGSHNWQLLNTPWPFEFATVFQTRASSYDSLSAQLRTIPR